MKEFFVAKIQKNRGSKIDVAIFVKEEWKVR
jgi:hypothetical protein